MALTTDWIAAHALSLWTALLLLALLAGDLAWRRSARLRVAALAGRRQPGVMRWTTGIALATLMLILFGGIAFAIGTGSPGSVANFDASLAEQLRMQMPPLVLQIIAMLTQLGGTPWVATAATLVLLCLLLCREWALAGVWAFAELGIMPLTSGIKALIERPRPLHNHGFVTESGWSFPSGHALGSMVFYGMLAYVLLRLLPTRWHRAVIFTTVLLVGLIGISRVLLQVHYLSDVVAGYAFGLVWLLLCISIAEWLRLRTAH
ncbi:undecaprenyl-diphosphatase [Dyella sp. OK004]|uniref:phosphatase PAP2 family protein n=1 Tax=Dyella sp. OK004 TaxID=1855292 RepID=UPI0008E93034|nr:phosphatase PAP2 family protein [Dyella sp. OK004]SFS19155.1 undecaprenyl-diphosphatase [Dyella sp. OK004]